MNFEEYFLQNLPSVKSFHPHFNEALAWILRAGGKHFRAQLLLGVTEIFAPKMCENAYPVAMAVEIFHAYSLIHDDLPAMDNAPLRRGVTTLHKKYDETTAILAGDALNTHAFYMIAAAPLPSEILNKCTKILAQNGGIYGMVLGQAIDCFFEKKPLNLEQLTFLHTKKTGALIAASMQMGAVIASQSEKFCDEIYKIGEKLGLIFQINDDIIDATSDEKSAGKPTKNDTFKNSFVNLMGLEKAKNARDNLELEILKQLENSPLLGFVENLINKYLKG